MTSLPRECFSVPESYFRLQIDAHVKICETDDEYDGTRRVRSNAQSNCYVKIIYSFPPVCVYVIVLEFTPARRVG